MPPLTLPDPPLTDGVVTLREHRPEDRDAVVAAVQDPEIPRWTTVPSPYGPDDYDRWLHRVRELRRSGQGLHLLVVDSGGRLVGAVGLHETHTPRPDIGYWIAAHARGRGHAARAVRLMRDHALALGLKRVDVLVHHENEASKHVARAAGFEESGELVRCPREGCGSGADFVRFTWPPPG